MEVSSPKNGVIKSPTKLKKRSTKSPKSSPKKQKQKDSEEDLSDVEQKYKKWRAENIVHPTISIRNLKVTYKLLDKTYTEPLNVTKRKNYCRGEVAQPIAYDSTICLFRGVRRCILTKNWKTLTELLRLLLYKPKKLYGPYIRKVYQNNFCIITQI